jgi:uncharacterized cupredoxin-like copper-binding protein
MKRTKLLAALVVLMLALAACSSDDSDSAGSTEPDGTQVEDGQEDDGHDEAFAFGEPADASDADRTIEITMLDTMQFEPDDFEVAEGETVTFSITNTGVLDHDFTLGDEATQDAHEEEMAEMSDDGHDGADANAVLVEAGQTEELTWTFTTADELLIGCHVPGHYEAGMVAQLQVAG